MSRRCIIPGCFGEKNRSFFRVPRNNDSRENWLEAIREVCPNMLTCENFSVCEKHFRKTDFTSCFADKSGKIVQEVAVERKRLKPGVVPHFDILNLDSSNDSVNMTLLMEQAEPLPHGKRFLKKIDWFQPQHHLEHGLVTLQNSSIKMHTLVKEEIEKDSTALHDDMQFNPEHPDSERVSVSIMQTTVKIETEEEPPALHDDIQVKHQHPDCEREIAFNMYTAIKSETKEDSANLHDNMQFQPEHLDRERGRVPNMQTAVKIEIEEEPAALHNDIQAKHQRPDCEREIAFNLHTAIKSETKEDSAALHDGIQVKHQQLECEKEIALNMQKAIKTKIEEESASLHCDVQFKHEHFDREREIALNTQTAIKSEIQEDSAGIYHDVPVKPERSQCTNHLGLLSELYADHKVKEELVIGPVALQRPGPSTEQLFVDISEDLNSLSDFRPETINVNPMEPLIGSARFATSETESLAASDNDVVIRFNASGIKKTYSKQGAPLPEIPRQKRIIDILEQEKPPEKVTVDTDTEKNVSETLTAEASVGVQSTESAEDKQLTAEYKAFTCDDCREQFQSKRLLIQHVKIHSSYKEIACNVCNKYITNRLFNLKMHLRVHSNNKHFSCPLCPYKCTQETRLKKHMRAHSSKKPFSCPQCPYKCIHPGNLKTHIRKHCGKKPFACNRCQFKSTNPSNLKTHMRTHTGEKPFSCPQCPDKFTQKGSVKKHILRKHKAASSVRSSSV